jgi:hypothetical protein
MALCLMPHQTRPDRAAMAFKPEALCLDASACSRPLTVQSTGCYPTRWAGHAILKPCHAATSLALLAEVLPATDRRRTPASPPARSARRRCRAARPEPLSRPAPAAATLPPFLRAAYRRRPAPQGRRDVLLQQIGRHVAAARANLKMSMTTINEPLTGLTGLPPVVDEMFRDRAIVFCEQLRWDLTTDKNGREIDPVRPARPNILHYRNRIRPARRIGTTNAYNRKNNARRDIPRADTRHHRAVTSPLGGYSLLHFTKYHSP